MLTLCKAFKVWHQHTQSSGDVNENRTKGSGHRSGSHCNTVTWVLARQVVRSIDVTVRDVRWSDSGELVALIGEASFYVLRFSREAVDAWLAGGGEPDDDGVQDAFELLNEVSERVRTGAPARCCAL